jgi:hypothetical protein
MGRKSSDNGSPRATVWLEPRVAHMAYLEALVSVPDDGSQWRGIMAGLLVVRLVDAWREDPGSELVPDAIEIAGARDAVDRVPTGTTRHVLNHIIDLLAERRPSPARVAEAMLAYARELARRNMLSLAEDVLATAVAWRDRVADSELRFDLSLALASTQASAIGATRAQRAGDGAVARPATPRRSR